MSDAKLPATVELCQRTFNAGRCQGVIYRPQPDLAVCSRCSGKEPGVVYAQRDRLIATAVLYLAETLAGNHPHLREAYQHAAVNLEAVLKSGVEYPSTDGLTTPGERK
jgi:hypothetical protein